MARETLTPDSWATHSTRLAWFAVAAAAALGLVAVQLLPTLELTLQATRGLDGLDPLPPG